MRTNERIRRRLAKRVVPDTRVEALLVLKGFHGAKAERQSSTLARYATRYGLTNTLGSTRLLGDQWLVLTEHRFLLFSKRGSALLPRVGKLEHELHRTDVDLQWADFIEASRQKRLIHLTTTDQRMNISTTAISNGEADLLVRAVGDRGREIGLQEISDP